MLKFRKLGLVFDLTKVTLPEGCVAFAQSPQAIAFEGYVRVYFSTRSVDPRNGKFKSEVAYVDMAPDFSEVLRVSPRPVIGPGGLGCFDEHGIFPMHIRRSEDGILAYTSGWSRRVSVSVETAIGIAISRDGGETFERLGPGPVLGASLREPFLVGDPFVVKTSSGYTMFYIFGTEWMISTDGGVPERVYKIGSAISSDGLHWTRPDEGRRLVPDELGYEESQALPTVFARGDTHHMVFCFRESTDFRTNPARGYRLGHAVSRDLRQWRRSDDELVLEGDEEEWDREMRCYPHLFSGEKGTFLLYNGNRFGRCGFGAAVLEG